VISGILPVDKPLGWTSHDVVARVRRLAGQRQVGHAGTLDPLATGVLLLVLGDATRLSSYLMDSAKTYRADVVLGATTVTDDAEAPLLPRGGGRMAEVSDIDRSAIDRCVRGFVGRVDQVPPAYAAARHGGEKLYALARKGVAVEPEARGVIIHSAEVESWEPPRLRLRIRCGPGTYIRALARDIGNSLGVGAYLHALRRTASGDFSVHDCWRLEAAEGDRPDPIAGAVLPAEYAVLTLPAVLLSAEEERAVRVGRPVAVAGPHVGEVRLYGTSGTLIALGRQAEGRIRPFRVFAGER
jgi:tRNA pseudouridine55 synthase